LSALTQKHFLKSNLTIVYVYLRDDDVARFHFFKSHPTD
jgi:hypothetical protein